MAYKKGDRVIGCGVGNIHSDREVLGTVKRTAFVNSVLVEFDEDIGGHNGNDGSCKVGHGWFCTQEQLSSAKRRLIVEVDVEGKL